MSDPKTRVQLEDATRHLVTKMEQQMTDENQNVIVLTDVETTGLKAHKESLLEIACIVVDTDFNVLSDEPFRAVVRYTPDEAEALYGGSDEFVQDMHTKTGLWEAILEGTPLAQIETDLLAFIKRYAPEKRQAFFGGNSFRLDFNFIEEHLPAVAEHMHYRMVDISTLALLCKWDFDLSVEKDWGHAALADITESLEELRILWGTISHAVKSREEFTGEPIVAHTTAALAARS